MLKSKIILNKHFFYNWTTLKFIFIFYTHNLKNKIINIKKPYTKKPMQGNEVIFILTQ